MLQKIADFYEDEVDAATKDMLAMLEPVIIGMLGVIDRRHRHFALHAAVRHDRQTGWIEQVSKAQVQEVQGFEAEVSKSSGPTSRHSETATSATCLQPDLKDQPRHEIPCNRPSTSGIGWCGWSRSGFLILTLLLGIELAVARFSPIAAAHAAFPQHDSALVQPFAVLRAPAFSLERAPPAGLAAGAHRSGHGQPRSFT